MGGIGGRLGRLERVAGEHVTTVSCPECGHEARYPGDLAVDVVVAQWLRAVEGEEVARRAAHPTVNFVLDHPHPELTDAVLADLPAFGRAR